MQQKDFFPDSTLRSFCLHPRSRDDQPEAILRLASAAKKVAGRKKGKGKGEGEALCPPPLPGSKSGLPFMKMNLARRPSLRACVHPSTKAERTAPESILPCSLPCVAFAISTFYILEGRTGPRRHSDACTLHKPMHRDRGEEVKSYRSGCSVGCKHAGPRVDGEASARVLLSGAG